jgi:hypothetical protein
MSQKNTIDHFQQQAIDLLADLQKESNCSSIQETRFVVLDDCLTIKELDNDGEFKDIAVDMLEMFGQYGLVKNICIPQLGEKGFGKVAIELDNISQAIAARKGIDGKFFCGKPVTTRFIEQHDFDQLKMKS